ncbi:nardilysin [Sarracenia purpurea var. burkii]
MQAAAAMCVGMGSFSDPYEAQGLAHFLDKGAQVDTGLLDDLFATKKVKGFLEWEDESEGKRFISHIGSQPVDQSTEVLQEFYLTSMWKPTRNMVLGTQQESVSSQ